MKAYAISYSFPHPNLADPYPSVYFRIIGSIFLECENIETSHRELSQINLERCSKKYIKNGCVSIVKLL